MQFSEPCLCAYRLNIIDSVSHSCEEFSNVDFDPDCYSFSSKEIIYSYEHVFRDYFCVMLEDYCEDWEFRMIAA